MKCFPLILGTVWTASATVIASMLGSGLLALPWSVAQMGWIAGPLVLWSIAASTSFTSVLLADTYRFKDPVLGKRLYTYVNAVNSYLGWYIILVVDVFFLYKDF